MEGRFGHAFGDVRIHADETAEASAVAVGARAYTVGRDVAFAPGQYAPHTDAGLRLLAHELTHVVQQRGAGEPGSSLEIGRPNDDAEREAQHALANSDAQTTSRAIRIIQRDTRVGPAATGAPADWASRVAAAMTSAERTAMIAEALGIPVVDRTVESAGDRSPDPSHLVEFSSASRTVNYDDNLEQKRSAGANPRPLSANAGYTLHHGGHNYIVLSKRALEADDFFATRVTLNHEFDHVRQFETGSALRGDESEVDAWTSSFIREFHRTYTVLVRTNACYIDRVHTFSPLNDYFMRDTVGQTVRERAVDRIVAYHAAVIAGHPIHRRVFRRWIWLGLRGTRADLPTRVNAALRLGVDSAEGGRDNRTLDCSAVRGASFPSAPTVTDPSQPLPGESGGSLPGRRTGLEVRGGASIDPTVARAAMVLGVRVSLRSDQMIILSPSLGAHVLYLPSTGPGSDHVAAAIGEVGLRIQQPVRGFYGDIRAGGFVGLAMPAPADPSHPGEQPEVVGGFSGAAGGGYRWERIELGAEGRLLLGSDTSRVLVLGVGTLRF
jgi:hypothetical protein